MYIVDKTSILEEILRQHLPPSKFDENCMPSTKKLSPPVIVDPSFFERHQRVPHVSVDNPTSDFVEFRPCC